MTLWETCKGWDQIGKIAGTLYRLVESQEQIATLSYVDTLAEQALLETLLDLSKPAYPDNCDGLHYLLKTPFRYPLLKWGSRFGRKHEPAIFYGAKAIATTLAEAAYYRLVFWFSMEGEPPKAKLRSEHTLFSAGYAADSGIKLYQAPFKAFETLLTATQDYRPCQLLGTSMREAGVQAFEYLSARDRSRDDGLNLCVGLFTPVPFTQNEPLDLSAWLCETSATGVSFKQVGTADVEQFPLSQFLVEGKFPVPA